MMQSKRISRRQFNASVAGLGATGALAPFGIASAKAGGTLVWGVTQVPRHFNAAVQSGVFTMMPSAQIFASLVRYDDKWNPQPYLAQSWVLEDQGKSLVLKLVPNARFHDGKPITSEDVAYSIMTAKANHPFKTMFAPVEQIDTPDALTAVIRMSHPHPPILLALSPPFLPILPKHIFDNGTDPKSNPRNLNPVGSGAYKFVEYKVGEYLILEKNHDYFIKGRPHFDRVIFRFFKDTTALALAVQRKEVQFVAFWGEFAMLDRIEKFPGVGVTNKGGEAIGGLNWLEMNTAKKPFDDVRVRKAIAYAVDRDYIIRTVQRGRTRPALGPISPGSPFYDPNLEPYNMDLANANRLLDEAGLKRGVDGMRFAATIDYIPSSRDQHQNVAEYLKPQLKKIGIDLTVRSAPDFPTWAKRVGSHEFDMSTDAVFNWGDPVIGVARTYLSSNIRKGVIWSNTQSYSNPKVDELLGKAAIELNFDKRKGLYWEFQEIVVDDAPIVFISDVLYYTLYDKRLQNLPFTIWGSTSPIDEMHY